MKTEPNPNRLRIEVAPETLAACDRALDEIHGRRAALEAFASLKLKRAGVIR